MHQFLKYLLQGCTRVCHSLFPLRDLAGFFLFGYIGMLPNVYAESADITDNQESTAQSLTPYAILATDIFSNLSGGNETGTSGLGLLELGLDADLDELFGWQGTSFHISGLWAGGEDPSVNVGDFNTLSNIAAGDSTYFYEAWVQKYFMKETLRIKLGLTTIDADFMISEYSGAFINSGFGILPTFSGNTAVPTFPLSGLGALAQYSFMGSSYLQLGVYDGDAGADDEHGMDWDYGSNEGAVFAYEIGTGNVLLDDLNGTYKFGGMYHTGEFTDFRDGSTDHGNYSFYVIADQVLLNQASGDPKVAGFLSASYSPEEERNSVNFFVATGINLFSPFSGRDDDVFGVGLLYTDFSDDAVRDLQLTEAHVNDSESVLEIFYQAQITPWLVIKPEFQFIFDPMLAEDDAVLFGTRIEVAF